LVWQQETYRMEPEREPKPEIVELDVKQLETQLDRIEREMGEETARPFRLLLGWYLSLLRLLEKKNTSIGRLRRLLFGHRTERTRDVVPPKASADGPPPAAGEG
jgi:transposase